jgi:DedD protein
MIRLSQLFKRDSQPDDGLRASSTRSRTDNKFSSRGSRITADDPVLTEDPEHQRARHRLIGAAVLVLVAIIVLPRVLDSKPKTVSNDIAVTIVSSLPAVVPPQPTCHHLLSQNPRKPKRQLNQPRQRSLHQLPQSMLKNRANQLRQPQ